MKKSGLTRVFPIILILAVMTVAATCEKLGDDDDDNLDDVEGTVTDIDGNTYQTIVIANQEWMAENLKVTKYSNGDPVPMVLHGDDWENTTNGAYAIYDNNENMGMAYGALYNWHAVADSRGLCPFGWHVPSDDEWTHFTSYLIGNFDDVTEDNLGIKLKSCRQIESPLGEGCNTTTHPRWESASTHYGTDDFGFSGLPGGVRWYHFGNYDGVGYYAVWWTSSEFLDPLWEGEAEAAWFRELNQNFGHVFQNFEWKGNGFNVRCVKNV